MEWDLGVPDTKFYHSYVEPEKLENSVIAFDIENLRGCFLANLQPFPSRDSFSLHSISSRVSMYSICTHHYTLFLCVLFHHLKIPYHIMPYHTMPYHTQYLPYRTSFRIILSTFI